MVEASSQVRVETSHSGAEFEVRLRQVAAIDNRDAFSEAFQKKNGNIFYIGGGQDRSLLLFFFQKHGLKWLNIAL